MGFNTKITITNIKIAAFVCFVGIFITGSALFRYGVYSNNTISNYSPLLFAGMLLMWILSNCSECDFSYKGYEKYGVYIYILCCVVSLICFAITNTWNIKKMIFLTIIVPTLMVCFRFKSKKQFLDVYSLWMFFLRFCVVLMLTTQMIDIVTSYGLTNFIAQSTGVESLIKQAGNFRSVTYMGHPLFTTEIYISYYIFEHMNNKIKNRNDSLRIFIVALIGITLAKSKMGIVCIILCYLLFNRGFKKINRIVLLFAMLLVGYVFGIFDGLLERFMLSIETGDLTTGRNVMLIRYINNGYLKFDFWRGQSISDSAVSRKLVVALEYPILRWAYTMGVLITILLVILVFVYPLIVLIKRKQWDLLCGTVILFAQINSYAGIGEAGNKPAFFYIMCCLILNLSNYFWQEKKAFIVEGAYLDVSKNSAEKNTNIKNE